MSWVAPSTVTVAQLASAALWNEQVRDNMKVGRGYVKMLSTGGNFTLNSTAWANITATGLDLTLPGATSDIFQASWDYQHGVEAVILLVDLRTVTGSNYWGQGVETNTGSGILGMGDVIGDNYMGKNGTFFYPTVSGDYSGGNCNVRPRYRTGTAANKTLYSGTGVNPSLTWFLKNLGPAVAP